MDMINKDKPMTQFKLGDLVNHISPQTSLIITNSKKVKVFYIEPLVTYIIIDKNRFILMHIEGEVLNGIFHFNRHKQAY